LGLFKLTYFCVKFENLQRVVGLDIGLKRTGIAVGYTSIGIASGFTAVASNQLLEELKRMHKEEPFSLVVIGKPIQMNGEDSESTPFIEKKGRAIQSELGLPLQWQDERFTSKMASQALVAMNAKKSVRQSRLVIDEVSATLILQSFFDKVL
jgi:putative holliday junction resolvase